MSKPGQSTFSLPSVHVVVKSDKKFELGIIELCQTGRESRGINSDLLS